MLNYQRVSQEFSIFEYPTIFRQTTWSTPHWVSKSWLCTVQKRQIINVLGSVVQVESGYITILTYRSYVWNVPSCYIGVTWGDHWSYPGCTSKEGLQCRWPNVINCYSYGFSFRWGDFLTYDWYNSGRKENTGVSGRWLIRILISWIIDHPKNNTI